MRPEVPDYLGEKTAIRRHKRRRAARWASGKPAGKSPPQLILAEGLQPRGFNQPACSINWTLTLALLPLMILGHVGFGKLYHSLDHLAAEPASKVATNNATLSGGHVRPAYSTDFVG